VIDKEYFNNGLFLSELEGLTSDNNNLYFEVSDQLFKKDKINEKVLNITPADSNLDFDSFLVETDNKTYCIKLSFDKDNFLLKNESNLLKNNKSTMLPKYVSSGIHKIGEDILYLIHEVDRGVSLEDVGSSFIYEKRWMFLQCCSLMMNFKSETSFIDYADFVFKHFDLPNTIPEISEKYIYPAHSKESVDLILKTIREYFYSSFDFSVFECDAFCHGDLNLKNISTNGNLFKAEDFNFCFRGNPFLDVSFTCLNFNFNKLMFNNMIKTFCDMHDLNYDASKPFFRSCLKAACCIFMYRKFSEFLVEQCVYENKRQHKMVELLQCFTNLEWCFESMPFYKDIQKEFKKICRSPTKIL
jgi:hypothetical protein